MCSYDLWRKYSDVFFAANVRGGERRADDSGLVSTRSGGHRVLSMSNHHSAGCLRCLRFVLSGLTSTDLRQLGVDFSVDVIRILAHVLLHERGGGATLSTLAPTAALNRRTVCVAGCPAAG